MTPFWRTRAAARWQGDCSKRRGEQGKPTVLDGEVPLPMGLLPSVSHLALSEQGLAGFDGQSLAEIAARNGCWACVTRGAAPVEVHDGEPDLPRRRSRPSTHWEQATSGTALSRLALADGSDEPDAVRFANAAAALFVSRTGEERFPDLRRGRRKTGLVSGYRSRNLMSTFR